MASDAYSVYWPQRRWQRASVVASRLTVLYGGPHTSEPSFRRATVQPGDALYPIGVCNQVLYVLGRMRVQEIVQVGGDGEPPVQEYFDRYTEWRFLAPTCTTEVVIGTEGTRIHLDRPVPGDVLKRLTYQPRRGPRGIKHVSDEGRLTNSLSVQGIYRLAESSATDLDDILTGPSGEPIGRRSRKIPHIAPDMTPLF
ncbi:MAG TPA: hypothetical protein VF060_05070 [Trebonia sp.]